MSYMNIYTYIPWIHKFVMVKMECGISHKDTKHTDKCSNDKTKKRDVWGWG